MALLVLVASTVSLSAEEGDPAAGSLPDGSLAVAELWAEIGNMELPYRWAAAQTVLLRNGHGYLAQLNGAGTGVRVTLSEQLTAGDLDGDGEQEVILLLETRPGAGSLFQDSLANDLLVLQRNETRTLSPVAGISFAPDFAVMDMSIVEGRLDVRLREIAVGVRPHATGSVRHQDLLFQFRLTQSGLEPAAGEQAPLMLRHVARRDEGLSAIARRYRTTTGTLQRINGISNPNRIAVGQEILVPLARTSVAEAPIPWLDLELYQRVSDGGFAHGRSAPLPFRSAIYTVQPGDTLHMIALRLGVSQRHLRTINGLPESGTLSAGQVLFVPGIPRDKVLYLTFDDGPHETWTPEILDLLAQYHAHATFFVLGVYADLYPDLISDQLAGGHAVANHTYYHVSLDKVNLGRVSWELSATQTAIGPENQVPCFRPPYGVLPSAAWGQVTASGYDVVIWDIDPLDWKDQDGERIAGTVIERAHDGAIILLHDGGEERAETVAGLAMILHELSSQGYRFEAICQ